MNKNNYAEAEQYHNQPLQQVTPLKKKYHKFLGHNCSEQKIKQSSLQNTSKLQQSHLKNQKGNKSIVGIFDIQYDKLNKVNSDSNLLSFKAYRRVPFLTPKKLKKVTNSKKECKDYQKIKDITIKLKVIFKQVEKLLIDIKNQIDITFKFFKFQIQRQMTQFQTKLVNQAQNSLQKKINMFSNQLNNTMQRDNQNEQLIQKNNKYSNKDQDKTEPTEFYCQTLANLQKSQKIFGAPNQDHTIKGNLFSHMIDVRQKLRKDATNVRLKNTKSNPINLNQFNSRNSMIYRKQERIQIDYPTPTKRQGAKSIEKFQNQLKSLKNLLEE